MTLKGVALRWRARLSGRPPPAPVRPPSSPVRAARKPARTTKVAAAADPARARWVAAAVRVDGDDSPLNVPYGVFLGEARDAAGFVRKRSRPDGARPGLDRVRNRLPAATADDAPKG